MYDEAEANKRRKRYARPLIDKHMDVYRREGFQPWTEEKLPLLSGTNSDHILQTYQNTAHKFYYPTIMHNVVDKSNLVPCKLA